MLTGEDLYDQDCEVRRRWIGTTVLYRTWEELSADEQQDWEREADELNGVDYGAA